MIPFRGSRTNLQSIICLIFAWFAVVHLQTCFGRSLSNISISSRVKRGEPAEEEQFPYICSARNRASQSHGCGGTLIASKWVMTAAHCVDENLPDFVDTKPLFYCGILRREERDSTKIFKTTRCILHHSWTGQVVDGSDIALCELDRASGGPFPNLMKGGVAVSANDMFSVLGWGYFSTSSELANELQEGENVPFVSNSMCNSTYFKGKIKNSMICAGLGGVDACGGDSGGPLLIPRGRESSVCDGSSNRDCIVGITSFGNETCNAELPGVYTLVSCYRSWIDCVIQGLGQNCMSHVPCEELPITSSVSPVDKESERSQTAPNGRFPYMCSIRGQDSENHVCGATLVASQWIMTGAACLNPQFPGSAGLTPFIYCGIIDREDRDPTERFVATRCSLHHLWTGDPSDGNDIALCKLEKASNAAIPNVPITEDVFSRNNELTVLGWGSSESSRAPADKLKMISDLNYIPASTCNSTYWPGQITDSMICAGEGSQAPCLGDGGGPLLLPNRKDNSVNTGDPSLDLVIGIVSFGSADCSGDVPEVFTRVGCYLSWMNCIMEDTGNDCSVHIPCK